MAHKSRGGEASLSLSIEERTLHWGSVILREGMAESWQLTGGLLLSHLCTLRFRGARRLPLPETRVLRAIALDPEEAEESNHPRIFAVVTDSEGQARLSDKEASRSTVAELRKAGKLVAGSLGATIGLTRDGQVIRYDAGGQDPQTLRASYEVPAANLMLIRGGRIKLETLSTHGIAAAALWYEDMPSGCAPAQRQAGQLLTLVPAEGA